MVTTMATRHHNQSASRILWKLPLKFNLPLMVSFMQRDPNVFFFFNFQSEIYFDLYDFLNTILLVKTNMIFIYSALAIL